MNIFEQHTHPSMENCQEGTLGDDASKTISTDQVTNEAEQTLEKGLPVDEDPTIKDTSGEEKTIEAFGGAVKELSEVKASLEGIHAILSDIQQSGRNDLTPSEHAFTRMLVGQASTRIGAGSLVPSLESDNFFESHDVVASMESIGSAIAGAGKAIWEALKKLVKSVGAYVKNKFINLSNKFKSLRHKLNLWTGTLEIDFPLTGYKKCSASAMIDGLTTSEQLLITLSKVNVKQAILLPIGLLQGFNGDAKMRQIGWTLETKDGQEGYSRLFEPKEGFFTIVLPASTRTHIEQFISVGTSNIPKIASNIGLLEAMLDSPEDNFRVDKIKSYLNVSKFLISMYNNYITAFDIALKRKETGDVSARNQQTPVATKAPEGENKELSTPMRTVN